MNMAKAQKNGMLDLYPIMEIKSKHDKHKVRDNSASNLKKNNDKYEESGEIQIGKLERRKHSVKVRTESAIPNRKRRNLEKIDKEKLNVIDFFKNEQQYRKDGREKKNKTSKL